MTTSVLVFVLAASAAATPPRVALMPLAAGDGVKEQTAESFSDALAAELRKLNAAELITQREIGAVLSMERQKELLGCGSSECVAEIAGALNVDEVITGSVSRLGESWLLQLQRVDAKKGVAVGHASRRKKGGSIDDLLDDLPAVARELFTGMPLRAATSTANSAPAKPPPAAPAVNGARPAAPALPPPYADAPLEVEVDRSKLVLLTDGKGNFVAVEPFAALKGKFFAGTQQALYAQRVYGGGSSGTESFNVVFWDPRARAPYQASFDYKDGKYQLTCGEKVIPLQQVPAAKAKKALAAARLHGVRWQRRGYALARDDEGNWFYVDQARLPEENTDFRVYLGTQGSLAAYPAQVLAHDDAGDIFRAAEGKLKLNRRAREGEWQVGEVKTKLTVLPIEDHARQVYTTLGAYRGLPLGTPCDPHF